jgi:hypothetical protein
VCVALFQGGLGWEITLWFGILCGSAAVGFAMSLLSFPPASPVTAAEPEPVLDRAPTAPLA